VSAFPLIQQDQVCIKLQGQGYRLCFSLVQVTPQDSNKVLVVHPVLFYPVCLGDLDRTGPMGFACVQFFPYALCNMHLPAQAV
jgi:hypothetical protein